MSKMMRWSLIVCFVPWATSMSVLFIAMVYVAVFNDFHPDKTAWTMLKVAVAGLPPAFVGMVAFIATAFWECSRD